MIMLEAVISVPDNSQEAEDSSARSSIIWPGGVFHLSAGDGATRRIFDGVDSIDVGIVLGVPGYSGESRFFLLGGNLGMIRYPFLLRVASFRKAATRAPRVSLNI